MPPPLPVTLPPATDSPLMETAIELVLLASSRVNTRLAAPLAVIVNLSAPGPVMNTASVTFNSPRVNVIVLAPPANRLGLKVIVFGLPVAALASATASRRLKWPADVSPSFSSANESTANEPPIDTLNDPSLPVGTLFGVGLSV